jgi:hypothetical protein
MDATIFVKKYIMFWTTKKQPKRRVFYCYTFTNFPFFVDQNKKALLSKPWQKNTIYM